MFQQSPAECFLPSACPRHTLASQGSTSDWFEEVAVRTNRLAVDENPTHLLVILLHAEPLPTVAHHAIALHDLACTLGAYLVLGPLSRIGLGHDIHQGLQHQPMLAELQRLL